MKTLTDVIRECLEETLGTDISALSDSDELVNAGLHSLDFVRFIVLLEEKLDFTLNDSDLMMEYFTTIEKAHQKLSTYKLKGVANQPEQIQKVDPRLIKCIALDCDNVLWGGIVDEVGANGVQLGSDEIGEAYQDFQRELLRLYDSGVLIALCSKNDEAEIWGLFDSHPGMVLKREHITSHRINWNDKAENLLSIADELNIGLDYFLFVDDSEYEIERIRAALAMTETLRLNAERPHEYAALLRTCFDGATTALPGRAAIYKEQKERETFKSGFTSLEDYHRSLGTVVTIARAQALHIKRIAEISQRTNQFNLTNKRYSEAELTKLIGALDYDLFILGASDRFGDMGIVCATIVRYDESGAHVDAFFLSCRAFDRSLEYVMLERVLAAARERGAGRVLGYYTPTEKNGRFADFWTASGFELKGIAFCGTAENPVGYPDIFKEIRVI